MEESLNRQVQDNQQNQQNENPNDQVKIYQLAIGDFVVVGLIVWIIWIMSRILINWGRDVT